MKKFIIGFIAFMISVAAYSQSADMVTKILASKEATFGEVCYLTAVYTGKVKDNASETAAMNALFEEGETDNAPSADSAINYEKTAYYLAKMWNIKNSGLFFRLTKGNARYAYKQLKSDGIIPANADPHRIPSGIDLLNMYTLGDAKYVGDLGANE